jgi:hypothetical protein
MRALQIFVKIDGALIGPVLGTYSIHCVYLVLV